MNRNLFRRVEVAFPVLDKSLKRRVINEGLAPYLKDNTNAWSLGSDGNWHKNKPHRRQKQYSAQRHLMLALGALSPTHYTNK
jgi:polyphosphate kinase